MRITVRLNQDILQKAKKRAADEGRTLTSLIDEGLTVILSAPNVSVVQGIDLPVSKASGGVLPGVDLHHTSDLEEIMNSP